MREMINEATRTIEDSQTAQALHGLLSLKAETGPSNFPALLQAVGEQYVSNQGQQVTQQRSEVRRVHEEGSGEPAVKQGRKGAAPMAPSPAHRVEYVTDLLKHMQEQTAQITESLPRAESPKEQEVVLDMPMEKVSEVLIEHDGQIQHQVSVDSTVNVVVPTSEPINNTWRPSNKPKSMMTVTQNSRPSPSPPAPAVTVAPSTGAAQNEAGPLRIQLDRARATPKRIENKTLQALAKALRAPCQPVRTTATVTPSTPAPSNKSIPSKTSQDMYAQIRAQLIGSTPPNNQSVQMRQAPPPSSSSSSSSSQLHATLGHTSLSMQQPRSVIVVNTALDKPGLRSEQVVRSPLKKRPYRPTSPQVMQHVSAADMPTTVKLARHEQAYVATTTTAATTLGTPVILEKITDRSGQTMYVIPPSHVAMAPIQVLEHSVPMALSQRPTELTAVVAPMMKNIPVTNSISTSRPMISAVTETPPQNHDKTQEAEPEPMRHLSESVSDAYKEVFKYTPEKISQIRQNSSLRKNTMEAVIEKVVTEQITKGNVSTVSAL